MPGKGRKKKPAAKSKKTTNARARTRKPAPPREEQLQGPPPRSVVSEPSARERQWQEHLSEERPATPRLTGGDVDADWERAGSVGEEAVGGSVATPDQAVVDELGDALGVPQNPGEPVRTSEEILERRDQRRWDQEAS